jgi:hypothetical protein
MRRSRISLSSILSSIQRSAPADRHGVVLLAALVVGPLWTLKTWPEKYLAP